MAKGTIPFQEVADKYFNGLGTALTQARLLANVHKNHDDRGNLYKEDIPAILAERDNVAADWRNYEPEDV